MDAWLALAAGGLTAGAVYLLLARSLVHFVFGIVLLSNAANLVLFAAGRTTWGLPALVPEGMTVPDGTVANALPQALILTAIVIGFGLLCFVLVLVDRVRRRWDTADIDQIHEKALSGKDLDP